MTVKRDNTRGPEINLATTAAELIQENAVLREKTIEQCAKAAEAAADEWWNSLKAKDRGDKNAVDFGSLPDHIFKRVRDTVHLPADQPEG